jgi:hypothetical protein
LKDILDLGKGDCRECRDFVDDKALWEGRELSIKIEDDISADWKDVSLVVSQFSSELRALCISVRSFVPSLHRELGTVLIKDLIKETVALESLRVLSNMGFGRETVNNIMDYARAHDKLESLMISGINHDDSSTTLMPPAPSSKRGSSGEEKNLKAVLLVGCPNAFLRILAQCPALELVELYFQKCVCFA